MSRKSRGDTLVEVMVAFAIMAVVILSISTLMGMGLNIAQQSLETSLVRQQIDGQADFLRYAQDQNSTLWSTIKSSSMLTTSPVTTSTIQAEGCATAPANSFILYFDQATDSVQLHDVTNAVYYSSPITYGYVSDTGVASGMWIQVAKAQGDGGVSAYDFYIRGCWYSGRSDTPVTIGTIVRLYER